MRTRALVGVALCAVLAMVGCKKKKDGGGGSGTGTESPSPTASASPTESASPSPSATVAAPDPALVARGQYLAMSVAGCVGCHTPMTPQGPDMAKMFVGGFEFPEKFGSWRGVNIIQDKKTGIGDWIDE